MSGTGDYTRTSNLGLYKPTYAADVGNWGSHLNANSDTLDALLATSGPSVAFLPISGGTLTGALGGTTASFSSGVAVGGPLTYTATGATTTRSAQDRWHDMVNVRDFGAALDGVTNDTGAWAAARAAIADWGSVIVPRGRQIVSAAPTGGPSTPVLWKYDGNYIGASGTTPVSGMGTDTIESFVAGSKYFSRANTSVSVQSPVLRIDSTINHTGGSSSNAISSLRVNTTPTSANLEPTIGIASLVTSSKPSGGSVNALAAYTNVTTASGRLAFGANIYSMDSTGQGTSVTSNSAIGCEIDIWANGDDTAGPGGGGVPAGQGSRVILDVVAGKPTAGVGSDMVVGWGVRVDPSLGQAGVSFRRHFSAIGTYLKAAYSTEYAVETAGGNALWLATGQHIGMDTAGSGGASNVRLSSNGASLTITGTAPTLLPALQASASYANDAAAATGGVAVGQLYRNGSTVMIRVA